MNTCASVSRYIYIYIYTVITPHCSLFLSLLLTPKCCLHFPFYPPFKDDTPQRGKRVFLATSHIRNACILPVAAV